MTTTKRRQVNGTPAFRLQAWSADKPNGCREFTGALRPDGYAQLKVKEKHVLAHRLAYELANGPIPEGMEVRHLCDNRSCVKPEHLATGDRQANVNDCTSKKRHNWGEKSGRAKLNREQVQQIRSMPGPNTAIASQYGVSAKTVGQIKRRERWAHLPEEVTA